MEMRGGNESRGVWKKYLAWAMFAAAAALVATKPPHKLDMGIWKPLQAPVSLQPGLSTTPEFETQRPAVHRILIAAEPRLPLEKLACLLGVSKDKSCEGIPEQIGITWRVLQSGQAIASGGSSEFSGGFFTEIAAREIGRFTAKRGGRYYIELKVELDGGELKEANPKLLVETLPEEWKDEVAGLTMRSRLQPIAAAVLTLLGLLIWVVPMLQPDGRADAR
ncbi:MAG: hypothetical protein HY820_17235 [Acidobacteria bacterium]|nr:hypothetical protein [Acidobacteriota bacterium]